MSDSIIQIKNVNKWFGDFQVLKDINLEVKAKQKIVVCGPSGSGKLCFASDSQEASSSSSITAIVAAEPAKVEKVAEVVEA